jgi:hypothetical protein
VNVGEERRAPRSKDGPEDVTPFVKNKGRAAGGHGTVLCYNGVRQNNGNKSYRIYVFSCLYFL